MLKTTMFTEACTSTITAAVLLTIVFANCHSSTVLALRLALSMFIAEVTSSTTGMLAAGVFSSVVNAVICRHRLFDNTPFLFTLI